MSVRTTPFKTTIGRAGRVELPHDIVREAKARLGSGVTLTVLDDGFIELRVRGERSIDDLHRLFPLTVPIDDLETSLREEEQRLADEFR